MARKRAPKSADTLSSILAEVRSLVRKLSALVGDTPPLSGKDRMRKTKFAKGAETIIPTIAALADQAGLTLSEFSKDRMLAQLKFAEDLIPLQKQLLVALKKIDDTIFLEHSESWKSATIYYSSLRRLAKGDGDVAEGLAPVMRFFAKHGRRGAAAGKSKGSKKKKETKTKE
jgi:hypothetical protein